MGLDYPSLLAQLKRAAQKVIRSTVGRFLSEVAYASLPPQRHMLFVGKFLTAGQAGAGATGARRPRAGPQESGGRSPRGRGRCASPR